MRWSRWLRRRDRAGRVLAVGGRVGELTATAPDGQRYVRAAAINQALIEVGGFWAGVGRLYKARPIACLEDAVYDWVARHRGTLARFWGDPPEIG